MMIAGRTERGHQATNLHLAQLWRFARGGVPGDAVRLSDRGERLAERRDRGVGVRPRGQVECDGR